MRITSWKLAVAAGLLSLGGLARAGLIRYTANGVDLVYDDDRNVTWVADANLFATQYSADNNVVNQIIAAVPSIGSHTVAAGDFTTSTGQMSWWGALAWAQWLGSIDYGGANDWRLPSALNADGSGPCSGSNCSDSELGHLYYTEGGLSSGNITDSATLTASFTNLKNYYYWSSTEDTLFPDAAWELDGAVGFQYHNPKTEPSYGWAVRTGRIASIPEPATGLLIGLGLVGIGWARRDGRRPG
jgi:hypothetical protein